MGVSLAIACAGVLLAGIHALLLLRGVFDDPLVPKTIGLAVFALIHGGAVLVDVPKIPELFGLGGSVKLGLPVTSFVLFPFVVALLMGRFLAGRTRTVPLFVLSAAVSYGVFAAVIAAFGGASVEEGGATIRLAVDPFSTAVRGFLWVGLAAFVASSAASGPLLPARARQVLRGALCAVGVGVLLTVVLSVVLALAQGTATTQEMTGGWDPSSSGGSPREALAAVGALFTLLPAMLGNLWLLAHGLPVGLQGAPDFSGVPLVGEALADIPLSLSLLGHWPFGGEWRLLLAGPALGLVLGGMVAAGGASPGRRVFQGALVSVPYTALAALAALLVGVSAEVNVAGASFDVAFRASLAWMPVLLVVGALLGGLGGLLSGDWLAFAPRPGMAFAATAAVSVIVLILTLPLAATPSTTSPVSQSSPPTEPVAQEEPEPPATETADQPQKIPEDPAPESPSQTTSSVSPGSPPDAAFDALLPTLHETTTAPVMLPADLPYELQNVAVDADMSGEEYGILFLGRPTGNVVESYIHANDAGTIRVPPDTNDLASEFFEATSVEDMSLSDGTAATLRYMEPTMEGGNYGPYWEGKFERDGYTYTLNSPLPSEDVARRTLSSMVEVPGEGGESPEVSAEQRFISDYYAAVGDQDWATTYSYLDYASQSRFTEDEWVSVQQARQDASGALPVASAELTDVSGEGAGFTAEVLLTYTDGSQETVSPINVGFEDGTFRRSLTPDEIDYLRNIEGGTDESSLSEEAAVEDTIRAHYAAIGAGDFQTAYSYFGPSFRAANDEATWVSDEESYDIRSAVVEAVDVTSVSEDTASAIVDVTFEDNTGTPSFSLVWDLVREDGLWKLDAVSGGEV